jgi:hypothetical protein
LGRDDVGDGFTDGSGKMPGDKSLRAREQI